MNNNTWLFLSEGLYLFGVGGVNRIEESPHHHNGKSEMHTALYVGQTRLTTVKESVEYISSQLQQRPV